jgi:hypothetical protein
MLASLNAEIERIGQQQSIDLQAAEELNRLIGEFRGQIEHWKRLIRSLNAQLNSRRAGWDMTWKQQVQKMTVITEHPVIAEAYSDGVTIR